MFALLCPFLPSPLFFSSVLLYLWQSFGFLFGFDVGVCCCLQLVSLFEVCNGSAGIWTVQRGPSVGFWVCVSLFAVVWFCEPRPLKRYGEVIDYCTKIASRILSHPYSTCSITAEPAERGFAREVGVVIDLQ